ncbi:MAG: trypsin-like peptidase domain-containing protein [Dehalococcoidia bacterium]
MERAIQPSTPTPSAARILLPALIVGLLAGLAGGFAAGALLDAGSSDEPPEPTAVAATATAAPSTVVSTSTAPDLRPAIDRVLPAVVTIIADTPAVTLPDGTVSQTRNIGSGIVVTDAGHVITNFHVIDGADTLSIVLATGEQRPAQLVADDAPFTDLAVLQVDPAGLRVAILGIDAPLSVGDPVAVIAGASITAGNTVTAGVISGAGRVWARNGVLLEDLIQTDAPVNGGDSGGALVNLDGEVVGLVTTVVRQAPNGATIEGVAFAQSIRSLARPVAEILANGASSRARIGIERQSQHEEISPELAAALDLPVDAGALVSAVAAASPAEAAGVEAGDILTEVNGVAVDFDRPLVNLLKDLEAGAPLEITILRGEETLRLNLTSEE